MKLTVETIQIKDLQFGAETCFRDGILYVSKEDILAFAAEEPCFDTLKIDIARPGDSTRIINVVDVVQPRCKVSGNIDWPACDRGVRNRRLRRHPGGEWHGHRPVPE